MRPIDADTTKEHFKQYTIHSGIQASLDRYALKVIEEEPTVDAVPVIRCKDCYWYGIVELKKDGTVDMRYKPRWCFFWSALMNGDDYCSKAERKEECSR